MSGALIVFTTFPEREQARTAVRLLVEERLAACGTLVPACESIYRWKEGVETAEEVLVMLKTDEKSWGRLEERLGDLHPYEVPEMVALRAEHVARPYLDWLQSSV